MGISLKKHNEEAYQKVKDMFKESNKAAVVHPTGTGKTYIALKWIEESQGKTIYVAPSNHILNQVKEDIEKARENGEISEEQYKRYKEVKYVTYTSLMELSKMESGYDNIILDEFHRCGAPEWGKGVDRLIKQSPNAKVLGMTATPVRAVDNKDMSDELFEGNIASEMTLEEAVAEGIIGVPVYVTAIYSLEEAIRKAESKVEKEPNEEIRKDALKDIEEAKRYLEQAEGMDEIFAKYVGDKKEGKYIVFCSDIDDMHKKMQEASKWFEKVGKTRLYEVSYRKSEELNEDTIKRFREEEGKINLLFSVDKLNEGVHVDGIDGVIMLRKTVSPIIYMQQLGRALSAGNEGTPIVFDLVNNIDSSRYIYEFMEKVQQIREERGIEDKDIGNLKIYDEQRKIKEILERITEKLGRSTYLEKAYAIKQWMDRNNTTIPPSAISKNNEEARYGEHLHQIRKIVNKYKKMQTEERVEYKKKYPDIEELEKFLNDIDKNNNIHFNNLQLVKNWVEEHNWERLPSQKSENKEERSLGYKLSDARRKYIEPYMKKDDNEKRRYREENSGIEDALRLIIELYLRCGSTEQKKFARLAERGQYESKKSIDDILDILEILYNNGIDLEKLVITKTEKGKTRSLQLSELSQDNIDIKRIIKENNLDEEYVLKNGLNMIKSKYLLGKLSKEQIARINKMNVIDLETIGTRKTTTEKMSIDEKVKVLLSFEGELTDIRNDFVTKDGIPIGKYISDVRKQKEKLSDEQIEQLDNKNMVWNKKEGQMSLQEKLDVLLALDDLSDTKDLGSDANSYRKYIRSNLDKLSNEQIEELKMRGMRIEKEEKVNVYLRDALLIKEWMKRNHTTRLPACNKDDMEEYGLYRCLWRIRKRFIEPFEKLETESEKAEYRRKNPEIDEVIEIVNEIDENNIEDISTKTQSKNILKVKQWMNERNTIIPPKINGSTDEEIKLGNALQRVRIFIEKFIILTGEDRKKFKEDNPEVEYVIKIVNEIDLEMLHAIQEWMKQRETYQPPTSSNKDNEEEDLGKALNELRYRYLEKYPRIVQNYEEYIQNYPEVSEIVQEISKIDEKVQEIKDEEKKKAEEMVPTKLQHAKDVKEWIRENKRDNPPTESSKNEEEAEFGRKLHSTKRFVNKYRRLKSEKEKEEFRKKYPEIDETLEIVETIEKECKRKSTQLTNIGEITEWVDEHEWKTLPSQKGDSIVERRLGYKLSDTRIYVENYLRKSEEEREKYRKENPEIDEVMEKLAYLFNKCGNPDRVKLAHLIMEDLQKRAQVAEAKKLESMYEQELEGKEQKESSDMGDDSK